MNATRDSLANIISTPQYQTMSHTITASITNDIRLLVTGSHGLYNSQPPATTPSQDIVTATAHGEIRLPSADVT